jgi:hypothetical protein
MKPVIRAAPLLVLFALSACFVSLEPRIETAVLLAEGDVSICTPGDDPCQTGHVQGDGYTLRSENEDEEDLRLRFEPLLESGGLTIYLGEAQLRENDESTWTYVVARSNDTPENGLARFDLKMPDCNDMSAEQGILYGLERADSYSCTVSDLGKFRNFLIDAYSDRFADPDWWASDD